MIPPEERLGGTHSCETKCNHARPTRERLQGEYEFRYNRVVRDYEARLPIACDPFDEERTRVSSPRRRDEFHEKKGWRNRDKEKIMNVTRRGLGKMALAGISGIAGLGTSGSTAAAQTAAKANRSYISGVQFGLQPFCYHDLAMNIQNRPILIQRLVQNGMGMVELHATWCEPRFEGPGVSAQEARAKLQNWRVAAPSDYYRNIKKEFDDAGISIFTYYVNISDADTDAEIDATFEAAKTLGGDSPLTDQ
jgi:hypothetical protein